LWLRCDLPFRNILNPEQIADLFCLELGTSKELWNIDVLKLERQRLIVKKLWA